MPPVPDMPRACSRYAAQMPALCPILVLTLAAQPASQPNHPIPEWAQGAVWYQVFPERFANGNPLNDSTTPGIFEPDWTSDFYATSTLELESARAAGVAWDREGRVFGARSDVASVIPFRRYGGDLQGVVARLDELKDLGVSVLYFSPIFQARSEHKYETSDHRHVDESLGNLGPARPVWQPDLRETADPATWQWTEADRYFLDVVLPEAKSRGFRVVIDGVWNHVGTQHWAFADVFKNGRSSPYADWFRCEFTDDGHILSWVGWPSRMNGDLPQFRQTEARDLAPGPKAHVLAVTRRWMDPNNDGDPSDGIDGWRLDVAPDVGIPFWADWQAYVKAINPEAVTIGEIWMPAGRWIDAGCFDAQMNYPLSMALIDWLRGNQDAAWLARRIESTLDTIGDPPPPPATPSAQAGSDIAAPRTITPDAHDLAQMNLLTGHDTERIASMLQNPGTEYDAGRGRLAGNGYDAGRASPETLDRVVLAYAILAALPGSPMVFQGDEFAMTGGDDPECRKPVAWPDLGPYTSPDDDPDLAFRDRVRGWLHLRSDPSLGDVLRFGTVAVAATPDGNVLSIRREWQDRVVFVIANRADSIFSARNTLGTVGVRSLADVSVPPRSAMLWELP